MSTPSTGKLADSEWRRDRASKAGRTRTTPEYHLARVREMVAKSREAQGLPAVVTDELTLGRIADLLTSSPKKAA